ncbi:pyridoxal phosphate-dependent decarboxylase family protein [Veronia pacifica]|uniref:Pyridoxal-dependent decarboxylase n=1 Tax=Veronia pacifica TaxID=1080227 RepID=A0A1C3ESG9_9GAMM|nr:aspartate aminotransferase family protein [Veronia pacifica]ODA36171.1 hypothetical protein A8L45_00785 [Veronia pacifica]
MTELSDNAVYTSQIKLTDSINYTDGYILNSDNWANYVVGAITAIRHVGSALSNNKVFSGQLAHELNHSINTIDLEQPLPNMDAALEEVNSLYLSNAVYFQNPKYVAHLNCAVAYPGVIAEQILTAVNSSLDTYDGSGAGTLIEQKIIDWTADKIGFSHNADGVFTSGGSQSNLMALLLARDNFALTSLNESIKDVGITDNCRRFKIFTSSVCHFTIKKSAAILGLGFDSVISIPVDSNFKMDLHELERSIEKTIEEGGIPICIVGTAGTTDYGSVDPLDGIAPICKKYDMWFHVDAAYGCGLLVSQKHKEKLNGISHADSVTVDYHKSFLQPTSCSAFYVKDRQKLSLLTYHAEYLNPLQNDTEKTPNLVDKSLQTTRRFDALKLWLTLRVMGSENIGKVFDSAIELAGDVYELLMGDDEFEVIHSPETSAVVFRYFNKKYSNEKLNKINYSIKEHCFYAGNCAIASTKFKGIQYLKFTILNPTTTYEDIVEILSEIKSHAYLIQSQKEYMD